MEISKKRIEDLMSAADKIIAANGEQQENLFGDVKKSGDNKENIRFAITRPGEIV